MLKVIDLFCGIGGFSDGFIKNGYDVFGVDIWDKCLKSPIHNGNVLQFDISKLQKKDLPQNFNKPDIIIGSPPCQTFSTANQDNRTKDESLINHFRRIVEILKPKFWVWENVVGSTSVQRGQILDAQNFGVAQRRKRNFVSNFDISDTYMYKYKKQKLSIIDVLPKEELLGIGILDGYNSKVYSLYDVSPTIRRIPLKWYDDRWGTNIPKTKMRFSGFEQLSLEHHLILMGFDRNLQLIGTKTEKMIQIGNCVSPVVAYAIAERLLSIYDSV